MGVGDADSVSLKTLEEARPDTGGAEIAMDDTGGIRVVLFEPEDFLDLDVLAVHAGNFTDTGQFAISVG